MMNNFENQIIDAIKKIRDLRQRPGAVRIFRTITKDAATNISLADVQQKIDQMISSSQLQNKPFQGMDSYYVLSDSIQENNSICDAVLELFEQKLDTTPPIKVSNSVETPSLLNDLRNSDNTKNMSYDVDVQLVAIKAYFMNEIYELKREISQLKGQEKTGKCDSSESTLTDILKSQICILQEQNSFIKSELQQKQIIIEKLLDINKNQIKNSCPSNGINQSDKRQGETNNSKKVVHQFSKEKGNPNNEHIRNTRNDSNNNTRKKITVIGDSMVKFLRSDEMSSVNNAVNVMKHPGSTTDDMVDYVRPVTRKKPDVIIMHVGTNDLTKGVNTMSKVRKIVSAIQEVDSTRNIRLGFSSIVQRADKDYSKEIEDINTSLKSYCLGKGLIFVDNSNIDESCINDSKFHLSKKGTQLLSQNLLRFSRRPLKHVSTNNRE